MSSISSQPMDINTVNNNINNNKFINNSPKLWNEYALFGSWTEEDLYETYKYAFYDQNIDIKELIGLYMMWKKITSKN